MLTNSKAAILISLSNISLGLNNVNSQLKVNMLIISVIPYLQGKCQANANV